MSKFRDVSNEEFERAYYGDPSDEASLRRAADNRNIIAHALKRFKKLLGPDDLESLGMTALWKTLAYHRAGKGKKFTTNLHQFVRWEVEKELKRDRKHSVEDERFRNAVRCRAELLPEGPDKRVGEIEENLGRLLYAWQRRVLTQYYTEGLSYEEVAARNGMSKEKVRRRISEALEELRKLCV